jgi:hemoglobin
MASKETLLKKLGGQEALKAAVDIFYERLIKDDVLAEFFVGVDMALLKWHQLNFMSIAFTEIPKGLNVAKLISDKHARLFDMGLCEKHFDIVAGHFVGTLESLGVTKDLIDEAVGVIAPLRPCFIEGAKLAADKKDRLSYNRKMQYLSMGIAAIACLSYQFFSH